jgi:probable O-glycosylation ligase (exosortase A-associated)
MRAVIMALLAAGACVSIARPWIGIVIAYLFAVLTPQTIWWWSFTDLRPVYWILLPTLVGFCLLMFKGKIDFSIVRNRRSLALLLLWICFTLSFYFGPYVNAGGPYRFTDAAWAMETIHKMFLLSFVGTLCIDDRKKLLPLAAVVVVAGTYLIYWANMQYLTGQAWGRLAGPVDQNQVGIYADENNFSMVFVVAQPFIWYMGFLFKNRLLRWGLWLIIPFGWHAVFLTASRGGLIGLAVVTLLVAIRSRSKALGLLLIPALIAAYMWQAGDLMKARAGTIETYKEEASANQRLEAWSAARAMIADNPLTGVGLTSFGPAFSNYSEFRPREAHNTFLQISAESGLIAGFAYLTVVVASLIALWRNGSRYRKRGELITENRLFLLNEAILVAFAGLAVCSLFLSHQVFEMFYFLCLLVNSVLYLSAKEDADREAIAATEAVEISPAKRRSRARTGFSPTGGAGLRLPGK